VMHAMHVGHGGFELDGDDLVGFRRDDHEDRRSDEDPPVRSKMKVCEQPPSLADIA